MKLSPPTTLPIKKYSATYSQTRATNLAKQLLLNILLKVRIKTKTGKTGKQKKVNLESNLFSNIGLSGLT